MKKLMILICCVLSLQVLAQDEAPAPVEPCPPLKEAVENSLKEIAIETVAGTGDDSVPRETSRQLRINNHLLLIQMNLGLGVQIGCSQRTKPIDTRKYFAEALQCGVARLEGQPNSPKCNWASWTGSKDSSDHPVSPINRLPARR